MFVALFALVLSQVGGCPLGSTSTAAVWQVELDYAGPQIAVGYDARLSDSATSTSATQSIKSDESLRLAVLVSEAQASAAHCLIKYQLLNQENLELEAGLGDAQDEIAHLRSSLTSSTAAVREISVEPSPIGWLIPVASALVVGAIGGGALAKAIWGH